MQHKLLIDATKNALNLLLSLFKKKKDKDIAQNAEDLYNALKANGERVSIYTKEIDKVKEYLYPEEDE